MRPKDAAIVALRIAAIYFAVQGAAYLSTLLSIIGQAGVPARYVLQVIVPPLMYGVAALVLWSAAGAIADGMTRETVGEGQPAPLRLRTIHAIAISVAGLVVAVLAIPGLVQLLFADSDTRIDFTIGRFGSRGARAASQLVQLGLGLWLWLGARGVAGMLRYGETPGVGPAE